jgi:hypothetical protein
MKEQFITDEKGRKISVILSIARYKRMQEDLEELQDIRLYDEVKARKESSIPLEKYLLKRKKSKHAKV